MKCPSCGTQNEEVAVYCGICGNLLRKNVNLTVDTSTGVTQLPQETQGSAPGGWAGHTPPGARYDLQTWSEPESRYPPAPSGQRILQPPPPSKRRLGRLGRLVLVAGLALVILVGGSLFAFGLAKSPTQANTGDKTTTVTVLTDPTALPPTATPTDTPTDTPTFTPTATPPPVSPGQLAVSTTGLVENCAALSDFVTLSNTGGQAVSWSGNSTDANFVVAPTTNSWTLAPSSQVSVQIKGGDPALVPGNSFSVYFKWSGPTLSVTVTCK